MSDQPTMEEWVQEVYWEGTPPAVLTKGEQDA